MWLTDGLLLNLCGGFVVKHLSNMMYVVVLQQMPEAEELETVAKSRSSTVRFGVGSGGYVCELCASSYFGEEGDHGPGKTVVPTCRVNSTRTQREPARKLD